MKIRSLTLGIPLAWPADAGSVAVWARGLTEAARRLRAAGWAVQTTRLAVPPFPELLGWREPRRVEALAAWLDARCVAGGPEYVSLGPVPAVAPPDAEARPAEFAAALPAALTATERVFGSVALDGPDGVRPAMAEAAATTIATLARTTAQGFGNLRFAALARCSPGIPFFPAAYHAGGPPALAVALEAADLALAAFDGARTIASAQAALVAAMEAEGGRLVSLAEQLCAAAGWRFTGVDLSPAPFPDAATSIAGALERLGLDQVGAFGTLYAARCVTDALRRVRLPRCGFSGLMLPVLEDSGLGAAIAAGRLGIPQLLLYSAVCGTGLDTVPLPGDVTEAELAALLLDVAALAVALDKPLTARLLPVPGKRAGDRTTYAFPYFANTVVLPVPDVGATGLLARARG